MNQEDRELYEFSQIQPEELQYRLNDGYHDPIWDFKMSRPKKENNSKKNSTVFGGEKC